VPAVDECSWGPLISTAMVAAIGSSEAFERGRDFAAWPGLVPRQYSTGGRSMFRCNRSEAQGFRYPPRGRRNLAAVSIELAIEELHGTDR
jgi:hypothetical protein